MYGSTPVVEAVAMAERVPPHLYFVVSAVFHYLGPAFAVLLFARVDVLGVAWLRIAAAALVFAAWRRPWRAFARLDRDGRLLLLAWGAVLALMNCCFYVAIDRLPLATVAAIEFLPVIALADPVALAAGAGVGISSSVIPYVSDQLAMRRLARATYALLVSLLRATATVIGIVVLAQVPSPTELLGVGLVVAGVAVHRERVDSHAAAV